MFKRILLLVVCMFMLGAVAQAVTQSVTAVINVSSFPVTGDLAHYTCDISSDNRYGYVPRVTISNSDITVAQTVTFYDNCGSTDTMTKLWEIDYDAAGGSTDAILPTQEYWYPAVPMKFEYGMVVIKSLDTSDVTVSIQWGNW